ncbi:MAG TPA: hypothetical protein VN032_12000, partial [Thermoanaerobaculia bacterium]|nr:hypothetical protein [Thermoanaerobaculia bacterium]
MKRRLVFLVAGVAAVSACKRTESNPASKKPAPPAARLTIVTDRTSLASLALLPLDQARHARADVFRLRPDRRFLIALGELELLVRRPPRVRLHLAWTGDAWRIDSSGTAVGIVPEMASLGDLRRVLSSWSAGLVGPAAARGQASSPSEDLAEIRSSCDRFESASAIRALRKIDAIWPAKGLPDPELAALAGRAFTQLSVMSLDTLELADLLRARALALLTLAGALGRVPDTADEALLASSLGYGPDAILIARSLPVDAPARLFVEGRRAALVATAERSGADRQTRYLALLSLASRRDTAAWSRFQEAQFGHEGFSLPVLRAAADVHSFEMDSGLGGATIYAAVEDLSGLPSVPAAEAEPAQPFGLAKEVVDRFIGLVRERQRIQSAGLVRQFESSLAKASAGVPGPLWDSHAIRAWHRGFFYSGMHILGRRYLDQLGTVDGTRDFAAYLQGSPEGPASQFAQWYGDLASVLSGGQVSDRHFDDLVTLTALGSASVHRMSNELREALYRGREASAIVAERVAGRLDGRPANVAFMQKIASSTLLDFRMVDRLCRGWLERGWTDNSELGTTSRCLWFTGDTARLTALLSDRSLDVLLRGEILWRYALSPNSSDAICRARYSELAVESGYEEGIVQG